MNKNDSSNAETVQAFNAWQRWFHIHLIHFVFLFIITGLPFMSSSFSFLVDFYAFLNGLISGKEATYSDGMATAQMIHRGMSIFFIMVLIPFSIVMLKDIKKWEIFPEKNGSIIDGVKQLKITYIDGKHARIGKYNIGQKLMAWTMIGAIGGLVISGIMLLANFQVEFARLIHIAAFAGMAVPLVIHIHFATLKVNRSAFVAMFRDGKLSMDVVKKHHPLWYEKLKK